MARLLNCFEPNCVFPLQYFLTHQDLENAKKLYFFLAMIALHENMISKFPNMLVEVNQEVLQDASSIIRPLPENLLLSTFLLPLPLCLLLVSSINFVSVVTQNGFIHFSNTFVQSIVWNLYQKSFRKLCYMLLSCSDWQFWIIVSLFVFATFCLFSVTQFIHSVPNNNAAQSRRNQACSNDYIQVSI